MLGWVVFSSRRSCGEESASIVFLVVGRIHFLVVVELKAQGMLTIGWRSPLGPRSHPQFLKAAGSSLPCGITQHDFWFHLVQKKRLWLQSAKQNLIYHNLKMGMNHLCHIPLVRSKSQVQQHLRKENYTKAWISGVGLIDNHLRVYLPWEASLQDDLVESFHWTTTYASVFKPFLRFLIFLKENIPSGS